MSEIMVILLIVIVSHSEVCLHYEKVNVKTRMVLESQQMVFPNSPEGFEAMSRQSTTLKAELPFKDFIFDTSTDGGGFLGKTGLGERRQVPERLVDLLGRNLP